MLRIQSRLSRLTESTRTHTHHQRISMRNNEVYSHRQNVTVKVSFQRSKFLQTPQASPPTFLFLPFCNCQKTDQSSRSIPVPQVETLKASTFNQRHSQSGNSRAKVSVASSAAALVQ